MFTTSVTRLGYFWKDIGEKLSYKSNPNVWKKYWDTMNNITFEVKTGQDTFWATFVKN